MIRIRKPKTQPAPLRKKGPAAHKRLCDFYAQPRSEPPVFEPAIYNAPAVRQALHKAQHGKCAYCERKLVRTDGDVEHFRPKAAVQQGRQDSPRVPGYYWLAYKWSNLLLSCQHCNQLRVHQGARRGKGNLFPLADPALRACSPADDLDREQPLLIDPAVEDPALHLTFERECVRALSARGEVCIGILGLDHPMLEERRRDRLNLLDSLRLCLELLRERGDPQLKARIHAAIDDSLSDSAEFAAMARAAFAGYRRQPAVRSKRRAASSPRSRAAPEAPRAPSES